jgi:hypothetical protein
MVYEPGVVGASKFQMTWSAVFADGARGFPLSSTFPLMSVTLMTIVSPGAKPATDIPPAVSSSLAVMSNTARPCAL